MKKMKLDIANNGGGASWSPYGMVISYFKNIKTKQVIVETDLMSKMFNIQNSLTDYKWKLESETKQIGDYLCYKATAIIPITKKEKAVYEEEKIESENNKTQFFTPKEPKDKILTAWYTPEIPVNQGPDNYWGLPGLILETNDEKITIICSKITLNPKQKLEIKIPKGKAITQKEFDILVEKKNKELDNVDFSK